MTLQWSMMQMSKHFIYSPSSESWIPLQKMILRISVTRWRGQCWGADRVDTVVVRPSKKAIKYLRDSTYLFKQAQNICRLGPSSCACQRDFSLFAEFQCKFLKSSLVVVATRLFMNIFHYNFAGQGMGFCLCRSFAELVLSLVLLLEREQQNRRRNTL